MNAQQHEKFLQDLFTSMLLRYSVEEATKIVNWFRNIRGSSEFELLGRERFDGMMAFIQYHDGWDLYNATMARAWVYAPFILAQAD